MPEFDFDKKENEEENEILQLLDTVVGEDKKYKTVEDAIKSIIPAQDHIKTLEEELAELRNSLSKSKTQEELLEEMRLELQKQAAQTEPQAQNEPVVEDSEQDDKETKEDDNLQGVDINDLIAKQLSAVEAEKERQKNVELVTSAALKVWGSEAKTKFYEAAMQNGYTEDMIKTLAASSPQAALHAIGLKSETKNIPNTLQTGTLNPASREFQKVEKPEPPQNWGNDDEVAEYMVKLQEYEDQNKGN